MTSFELRRQPTSTGVYLMKDAAGRVIYVGKAKSLRSRAGSYFLKGAAEEQQQWRRSHQDAATGGERVASPTQWKRCPGTSPRGTSSAVPSPSRCPTSTGRTTSSSSAPTRTRRTGACARRPTSPDAFARWKVGPAEERLPLGSEPAGHRP